jgi:hypothetical protein
VQQRQTGFTIAAVEGVTLTKWTRAWDERMPGVPLRVVRTTSEDQLGALTRVDRAATAPEVAHGPIAAASDSDSAGDPAAASSADESRSTPDSDAATGPADVSFADVAFVRLPVDDASLSVIPLYEEAAYVVVPKDHPASALDSLTLADLEGDRLLGGSWASAIELVGANVGVVVVPQSIARLHARGDVVARPVTDVPATRICLVWPADRTTEDVDTFVGIVRGRGVRSSRSSSGAEDEAGATERRREARKASAKGAAGKSSGAKRSGAKGAGSDGAGSASTGGRRSGRAQRQSAAEARAAANRRKRTRGA